MEVEGNATEYLVDILFITGRAGAALTPLQLLAGAGTEGLRIPFLGLRGASHGSRLRGGSDSYAPCCTDICRGPRRNSPGISSYSGIDRVPAAIHQII